MSNFINQHPNPIYPPSYNIEFSSSKLNGIARQSATKLININSAVRQIQAPSLFRDCRQETLCGDNTCGNCDKCCYLNQWSSSNFYVFLPETMYKVVTISLVAIEIPNTLYTISALNKTNLFTIVNKITKKKHLIEIPPGNYEIPQLVNVINNILSICLESGSEPILQAGYDSISGRFFFYNNTGDESSEDCCDSDITSIYEIDFSLPNNERDIKLNLGWMLGFRKKIYCAEEYIPCGDVWSAKSRHNNKESWPCRKYQSCVKNLDEISENVWTSENLPRGYIAEGIVDLSGPHYLFLEINDFNNNVNSKYINLDSTGGSFSMSNVLARISMPYSKNEIGFSDTSDGIPTSREYFGPVTIKKLHIKLVDDLGRIVDLNNNEISLLLNFEYLYNL